MGLRQIAQADLKAILEDDVNGFGWPITVTDPSNVSASMKGHSNDIGQMIDPETGQLVSGRLASVTLMMSSLADAGLGIPVGITNSSQRPWRVTFDDIDGVSHTFKVTNTMPDRTVGNVVCLLELWQ